MQVQSSLAIEELKTGHGSHCYSPAVKLSLTPEGGKPRQVANVRVSQLRSSVSGSTLPAQHLDGAILSLSEKADAIFLSYLIFVCFGS